MILYEYKKEDKIWSRSKVKDLSPGTPEFKFYERFNFIEDKWFSEQENLIKYSDKPESTMYKIAEKKIKTLENSYSWLCNFDEKPKYNIDDTIEELKRINSVLVNFLENMTQWHKKSDIEIKNSILYTLDNIHVDREIDKRIRFSI